MLTHLYDDRGEWTQRKNAATKLQHSGVATLVVYHIRHRVLHHNDMRSELRRSEWAATEKACGKARASTLKRGPDFAEHGRVHLFEPARATWVTQRFASL